MVMYFSFSRGIHRGSANIYSSKVRRDPGGNYSDGFSMNSIMDRDYVFNPAKGQHEKCKKPKPHAKRAGGK